MHDQEKREGKCDIWRVLKEEMLFPMRMCSTLPTHLLLIAPLMHMQSFKQIAVVREVGGTGSKWGGWGESSS